MSVVVFKGSNVIGKSIKNLSGIIQNVPVTNTAVNNIGVWNKKFFFFYCNNWTKLTLCNFDDFDKCTIKDRDLSLVFAA